MTDAAPRSVPTGRYSPLRYPGGKGKLARFVASVVRENGLTGGHYVEPYAGGAAVAWELLLTGAVSKVSINDLNRAVFSFWDCALHRTDELCRLIRDTPVDVETRHRQKAILNAADTADVLELAFATFFLNRTNRSGILNGGMIGGRAQAGEWKLDARYNKQGLTERIQRIAAVSDRVKLTNLDAELFLQREGMGWGTDTLVYLDPPYFQKGRDLYYDYYRPADHAGVAGAVNRLTASWIVSYDDAGPIHTLYESAAWLQYSIGYSARVQGRGREAMFASSTLTLPPVTGSMIEIDRWTPSLGAYRAPQVDNGNGTPASV